MRKKLVASFLCIINMMLFLLASCTGKPDLKKQLDDVVRRVTIEHNLGAASDMVTTNFSLPSSLDNATITWTSSKADVITILNSQAIVTRKNEDQRVVLTAIVTLSSLSKAKEFEVTVLKLDQQKELFYTISWSIDGVITTTNVKEGVMPTSELPTKEGYTFIGWDPQIVVASINATYTAIFKEDIKDDTYYTIYWNIDGVITTTSVKEGIIPTNDPPTKEGHTFIGWDPQIAAASINVTYTAIFKENSQLELNEIENQINNLAGEDIYSIIPKIITSNYLISNQATHEFPIDINIDIFDWVEADLINYINSLDLSLSYDQKEKSWIYNDFYICLADEKLDEKVNYKIRIYTIVKQIIDNPIEPISMNELHTATITPTNTTKKILNGSINNYLNVNSCAGATFDIMFDKNSSNITSIFNNSANQLRLYPGSGNGGQISIKINPDFEIVSIKVVVVNNYGLSINGVYNKSGNNIPVHYDFNSAVSLVTIKNIADATKNHRVDITKIVITYIATESGSIVEDQIPLEKGEATLLADDMLTLNDWQLSLPTKYSGVPSIGNIDILVIPIEIKGVPFEDNYRQKLELLFNGNDATTGWQSVASYYRLSSYGKLNLNFDIADKYSSINNKAYFESEGEYADEYAIYEAVLGVDQAIDFSKYDYNNDRLIDGVIFVYSVAYSKTVNSWWAWVFDAVYFNDHQTPKVDGKNLGYYMWVSYDFMNDNLAIDATVNAETYIHEMGHLLGQTDLYSSKKFSSPLGDWDMMDYNSGDHGPFTKLLWGWTSPLVVSSGYQYQIILDSYSTDSDGIDSVILIPRSNANFTDRNVFDEYLLIIFYTPEGLYCAHKDSDVGISNAGVVVYHVDARLNKEDNYWNFFLNDNDGDDNFLVQILEADKDNSIPSNNSTNIELSDFLTSGTFDLSSYYWNQGGKIDVLLTIDSMLANNSSNVSLTLMVY